MYWKVPSSEPSAVSGPELASTVGRAAMRLADERPASGRVHLGEAEVEQLDARLGEHHVARLEVAMDDPLAMGAAERVGDLDAVAQELIGGQRSAAQALRQRLAFEVLHDQELGRSWCPTS